MPWLLKGALGPRTSKEGLKPGRKEGAEDWIKKTH
jgi:hypothetical protein